ncbi:DUF6705 family protein [Flavobacterium sp.]|uniref:DUF6705 family protein n=1 Tax=Flavobacterium sp. TaxID=239 RepID=UPI00333F22D5
MKKLIYTIVVLLVALHSKAQSPVVNIEDDNGERPQNIYYKDINNLLDPYVGTYIYTNGTTSLKFVLQKKVQAFDGWFYEDVIVGEYQYIENGVEKVNTLNNFNINHTDSWDYNILGNWIIKIGLPGCEECTPTEKRLRLSLRDTVSGAWANLILAKTIVNGQQAIRLNLMWDIRTHIYGTPELTPRSFLGGEFILIKQ